MHCPCSACSAPCMSTASTFQDNEGGFATTAGTLHPAEVAVKAFCNHCRLIASMFIGTASLVATYCIHLVEHCIHCMSTATTFQDNAGDTASTAATLHSTEVALLGHCHHCRIPAFPFIGTAYCNTPQCLRIVGNCIHSMSTASKFQDKAGSIATTAGTLHPADVEM